MKLKAYKHLTIFFLAAFGTIVLYLWFINSSYLFVFKNWAHQHFLTFYLLLVAIKIFGIVWPPIPGGFLTFGSIPIIGWLSAYSTDLIGSMVGSSIAYFLARKYGFNLLYKIFDEKTVVKIASIKIKPHREIEAVFLLRLLGGTVVEVICYGAGLLKVRYVHFLTASIISHLLAGVPLYYLFNEVIQGKNIVISGSFMALAAILFVKFRKRYISINS